MLDKRGHRIDWSLLAGSFVIILCALGFGRLGYPAILPYMRQGLSLSNTQMGLLATANLLGYHFASIAIGLLTPRFGPRAIVIPSLLMLSISLAMTGLAPGFLVALVLQLLIGVFSAGCVVTTLGVVTAFFGKPVRGRATGLAIGGAGLGQIVAGLLVVVIQGRYPQLGWRYSWLALGCGVLLVSIIPLLAFRPTSSKITSANGNKENRSTSILRELLRNPTVRIIAAASVFNAVAIVGYNTFFVAFLITDKAMAGETAARLWQLVGIAGIFSGILWGWLSDVWRRKTSLMLVFFGLAIPIALVIVSDGLILIGTSALLFGISVWGSLAIVVAIIGDYVTPRLTSAAIGFSILAFGFGQIAGATIAGYLADTTGDFTLSFALAAASALVATLIASLLRIPGQ